MNDGAQTTVAATPQVSTTTTAEPNDLDALIKEFDQGTKADTAPVAKLLRAIQPVIVDAENRQIKERADQIAKDFDTAYSELKSVPGAETMMPRALKGFMREYANEVPEIEQAWNNRGSKPADWQSALGKVKTALAEDLKANPASTLKTDTLAARAAVQNSSHTPAPVQQLSNSEKANMSDRDWNNYLKGRIAGK